jgi:hypothetical protein
MYRYIHVPGMMNEVLNDDEVCIGWLVVRDAHLVFRYLETSIKTVLVLLTVLNLLHGLLRCSFLRLSFPH